jgi:hypothetical protein
VIKRLLPQAGLKSCSGFVIIMSPWGAADSWAVIDYLPAIREVAK